VLCDFGLQIKNLLIHPTGDYDVHMVNVQRGTQGNTIGPLQQWLCQKLDLVFCGGVGWCSWRLWIINSIFSLSPGSSSGKHGMKGSWEAACYWLPLFSDNRKWNSTLFPMLFIDGLVYLGCPLLSVTWFKESSQLKQQKGDLNIDDQCFFLNRYFSVF